MTIGCLSIRRQLGPFGRSPSSEEHEKNKKNGSDLDIQT
jgi:hypothetical protein